MYIKTSGLIKLLKPYNIRPRIRSIGRYMDMMELNNGCLFSRYLSASDYTITERKIRKFFRLNDYYYITMGNGSDEIIGLLITIYKKIASFYPSFVMYERLSFALGKRFYHIALNKNFEVDLGRTCRTIEKKCIDLFFIAYPNNPTCNAFNRIVMLKLILQYPNTLFVFDEAYYPFSKKSFIDLIEKVNNVCILRTLSKIGFASLRFGYLFSSRCLHTFIQLVKLPYNVSKQTLMIVNNIFGRIGIDLKEYDKERNRLASFFKKRLFIFINGCCNFFFIKIRKRIVDYLMEKKIYIKETVCQKFYRISIGNKEENRYLMDMINEKTNI
ncbi:aminotransferase class I/II-fold pyridoxal phosphate-dependent enzyme [Candidatus Vidania fulgoroideorum]